MTAQMYNKKKSKLDNWIKDKRVIVINGTGIIHEHWLEYIREQPYTLHGPEITIDKPNDLPESSKVSTRKRKNVDNLSKENIKKQKSSHIFQAISNEIIRLLNSNNSTTREALFEILEDMYDITKMEFDSVINSLENAKQIIVAKSGNCSLSKPSTEAK